MNKGERLLAFLGAMFTTFGITDLDFKNPAFSDNQKAYASIILGVFMLFIFIVRRYSQKA